MALIDKILAGKAHVGVIGLGYVGLPLAVEFAKAGLPTVALDVDAAKIAQIERGESYIADVPSEEVRAVTASGHLRPTTDFPHLPTSTRSTSVCRPRCARRAIPI